MSYIQDYLKTCENSEAPVEYHVWVMLNTLSVFAGRRFWFPFGPMQFYPNLYTVLVGDPGMRKSTALNRGKNIIRASGVCPVAASQASKESMSLEMSNEKFPGKRTFVRNGRVEEYNQLAIFATELTQFIAINPLGMLDFLTTIWDEPVYEVKTKNKGNDYVMGPYITLCACMTPELVKGFLKQNLLSGGFARRTAFVFSASKNIVPIPSYTDEQKAAEHRCVEFGKALQMRSGEFTWTDDLKEFYVAWNQKNEEVMRDRHPNVRGWFQSKAEMLFKISMLVALSESKELVLELPHYKIAMRYCTMIEGNLERVFEGAGINPNAAAAAQICRMLEAMDRPMNRKYLLKLFFDQATSLHELEDTLTHLVSVGRLEQRDVFGGNPTMLLGTVIGGPATIKRYSDVELVEFLKRAVGPPVEKDMGSPPESSPVGDPPKSAVG